MSANNEKFINIIESAEQVLDTLTKLQAEIESYETAGKELNDVKKELLSLVASIKKSSNGMFQLSKDLAEAVEDISNIANSISGEMSKSEKKILETIKASHEIKYKEIIKLKDCINEVKAEVENKYNFMKIMLFITIALIVISILLSLLF